MDAIYDMIGNDYDTTRKADPAIVKTLVEFLGIQSGNRYLDVACGTGNYTIKLAEAAEADWFAFDQSEIMLRAARAKTRRIHWGLANAGATGYESCSFDGAVCTLAIHHFEDLRTVFLEVARVLKDQGAFAIFTATPEQMRSYWLCHYFPQMMERACEQMPPLDRVKASLLDSGFTFELQQPFLITPTLQDLFLYSGKQRPAMYLSEKVRNGISSFQNFCTETELKSGLCRLESDIASGAITSVMDEYLSGLGDYLFLRASANKTIHPTSG